MNNDKKYQIIPYPSEHVIEDGAGNRVVSCPTEQEAREYIKEVLEGEAMRTEEPVHNMNKKQFMSEECYQHSSNNDVLGGISSED